MRLNVRQGVIGGATVSIFSSIGVATHSADPLPALVGTFAFSLLGVALVMLLAAAVMRHAKDPPIRW